MGFYGNITNISKTNFVFDRIYTNRTAMDTAQKKTTINSNGTEISGDGIFIGRYVLIEYGEIQGNSFLRVYGPDTNGYYHSNNNLNDVTSRILYTENTTTLQSIDQYIFKGRIVYTLDGDTYRYYECSGGEGDKPTFTNESEGLDPKNDPYFYNLRQDQKNPMYNTSRGYDGTVWMKTTVNNEIKYVNIAELNSVVPTLDVVADAPTISPILPHFDAGSNNVYYKLHLQPSWGMRIGEGDTQYSDYATCWSQEVYDEKTGNTTTQYYFPSERVWRPLNDEEKIPTIDADIYFNNAAFAPQVGETDIKGKINTNKSILKPIKLTKDTYEKGKYYFEDGQVAKGSFSATADYFVKMDNYISVTADGMSGNKYNKHDGTTETTQQVDTQQIHINLPAIGNMMSEAWDIIHGTERDNYRGNAIYDATTGDLIKTGSLEGRMKAFEEIKANQIPVKRAADGTLVGSKINNGKPYSLPPNKDILDADTLKDIPNKFQGDDPWIETEVNTSTLMGGTKLGEDGDIDRYYDQTNNSGISIRHTFHGVQNSKTTLDKNSGEFIDESDSRTEKLQQEKLPVTNKDTKDDDTIKLYTPYVDATGHVVGKNIETITLPYGFKTVTATNSDEIGKWSQGEEGKTSYTTSSTNENVLDIVADSTKDTFSFKGGNKWIRFQTDAQNKTEETELDPASGNNTLTIAHETHDVVTTPLSSDFNIEYSDSNPNGIKYVEVTLNNSTYAPGKYYFIEDNEYKIDHNSTLIGGRQHFVINDKIAFQDIKFDIAGHVTDNQVHTYILPYGYKTFTTKGLAPLDNNKEIVDDLYTDFKNGTEQKKVGTDVNNKTIADNTQDIMSIEPYNKWIQTQISDDNLLIAHEVHGFDTSNKNNIDLNGVPKKQSGQTDDEHQAIKEDWEAMTDGNTIKIPDWEYDKAGHITAKQSRTYTLPYGYKKIAAENSEAVIAAPTTTTAVPTADNTQDTLNLTASNKWIKFNTLDDATNPNKIQIGHILSPIAPDPEENSAAFNKNEITCQSSDINIDTFGGSFKILNFATDNAGHIIGVGEDTITLPIGSYTAAEEVTDATEIITSIGFDADTGDITSTKASTSTLQLDDDYNQYIQVGKIEKNDFVADTYYVSNGTEYSLAKTWSDVDYYITNSNYIESGDTINEAFEKVQNQIYNIYGSSKIAASFDTIKEIADFLEQDSSNGRTGVEIIIDDIATLKGSDTVSGSVANSIKNAIEGLDSSISATAGNYISGITITDGKITDIEETIIPVREVKSGTANGTILVNGSAINVSGLKSAAYTNSTSYATAAQGSKADATAATVATYGDIVTHDHSEYATAAQGALANNALPKNATFVYTPKQTNEETGETIVEEVTVTIEKLVEKVAALEKVLKENGIIIPETE